MPTITATTSGNFNATTTWVGGVVPVDGDSFVIAAGHTVTYNVSTPVTTGFGDSTVNGILQSQSGASTTLRMNGRLNIRTNGTYHARAGHILQFRGTAAESHILYLFNETGASLIMEGSDGMPTTTLSAGANERATSFAFTSATNFAVGEWFSIFNHTTTYTGNAGANTLRDEGFWIHDIDSNTVYFRQFVGPESTVVSASGTALVVQNSKVFRVGQIIIFGTGANRNIHTITAINYSNHTLTLSGSVTGTVTGVTVYETGSDKIHASSDKVRKVATVTTASSLSTATTITIANANMFAANDEIWIEARSECGGTTDGNFNAYGTDAGPRYRHVVSSISGNVLTLSAAVGYNVVSGALITRLTRDVVVEPVTPNTDRYGVFVQAFITNYTRKLILKDVFFRYIGSSQGQAEGGLFIQNTSHHSTNSPAVTLTNTIPARSQEPWLEGISMTGSNSTRDLGGLFNGTRYGQLRCCITVGIFNSGILPGWFQAGSCGYNCIVAGSNAWGFRSEHLAEWGEMGYCYSSRNFRQARIIQYETNLGLHHFIGDGGNEHGIFFAIGSSPSNYKIKSTGSRWGPYTERSSMITVYSQHTRLSGLATENSTPPGTTARSHFHSTHIDRGTNRQFITSLEHNFEYDAIRQFGYGTERFWDQAESAWRVLHSTELSDYGLGFFVSVYVPANVTAIATCAIKLYTPYSGNYPRFEARDIMSGVGPNQLQNAGGNYSSAFVGGAQAVLYTSAAEGAYQEQSLTINPVAFPRNINIGVHVDNVNASEGYWMKPINIFLNTPYNFPIPEGESINSGFGPATGYIYVKDSSTPNKIRLGGRLY
jgi:hypothetical protein